MLEAIGVPEQVLEDLKEIRESGKLNMFDYHGVMRIAHNNDIHETVLWMHDHKKEYGRGIFQGFKALAPE